MCDVLIISATTVINELKLEFEKREVFFFDSTPIFVDLTSENAYVRKIIKYFTQCKKN